MSPGTVRLLTLFFLLFMVAFSFLPVPGTTLIMLYVVLFRPRWFKRLVDLIYGEAGQPALLAASTYDAPPEKKDPDPRQGNTEKP
ncbi:hypothetical protein MIN45_P1635 [Methylomarinovum tepidoasis]|uniref:Transmembrane protein n=1 Tax=Methylomarinovum tepidoasis TaxID=2840183 RepID=A0AAU9C033_9GAMM|nr:hypothetical protein [Methylomarinovum sp. IN45]BCX89263.1 hypothetical protein MIN45_P1635 [Methylomarinovum sp. IN45]